MIIATVDTCGLPLAMLKYLGVLKMPMIYISQGLAHRVQARSKGSRSVRALAKTYSRFLNAVERVLVLGEGAVGPLIETFDLAPERVFALPFGTGDRFWTPAPEVVDGGYILSVGSDAARDYPTLLRAVDGRELRIVTRRSLPKELLSQTVHVGSNYTELELRDLYRGARFVVIPLKDVDQPSGQSATLQAMACGKAVILTRTRGLWETESMKHLETCYLVEPGDVSDLKRAIAFLENNPQEVRRISQNARCLIEDRYNVRFFARDLEQHLVEVCA